MKTIGEKVSHVADIIKQQRIDLVTTDPEWSARLNASGMTPLAFIRAHSDDIGVDMHLHYERERRAR